MLDLNYVRENLEKVRAGLQSRGVAPEALDDFAEADAERRRIIAESDQLNADAQHRQPRNRRLDEGRQTRRSRRATQGSQ